MVSKYIYDNNVKIKIWEDEFRTFDVKPIRVIEKEFDSNIEQIVSRSLLVIELYLPRNISNYGLLGVKCEGNEGIKVEVDVFDFDTVEYIDNLGINSDYIHLGLPEDYVEGIFSGVEKLINLGLIRNGKYKFFIGAHGEVGSSINIFDYICRVLMKLFNENEINSDVVEKIIKDEL